MSRTWKVRAVALTLAATFTAPAAWAGPLRWEGGFDFGSVWGFLVSLWEKAGPGSDQAGAKVVHTPSPPLEHVDEGPTFSEDG